MRIATSLLLLLMLSACGGNPIWLPRAHKMSIQQGNLINEQQLSRVEVGMDREIVRNLIGTPVQSTPFKSDSWEYVYTQGPAGAAIIARRVTIEFDNNVVSQITSNQDIESGEVPQRKYWWEKESKTSNGE